MSNFNRAFDCCRRLGTFTSSDIAAEAGITTKFASGYIWMLIKSGLVVKTDEMFRFKPGQRPSIVYRWHSGEADKGRPQPRSRPAAATREINKCDRCGTRIGARRHDEPRLCFKPACRESSEAEPAGAAKEGSAK